MFDLINPSRIFYWIEKLINFINSIFFILLIIALTFALILSPPDYLQGDSVRIMYVHVPSAWIGMASFTCIGLLSIANFIFKIKNLTLITKSIAPLGLMFTCLAIVTGSLWGQPTWGTWWVWDARLTSMIILALFYIGFIISHKFVSQKEKAHKISSLIAIIGLIILRILNKDIYRLLPPLILPNTGNMGMPLCLFAYGKIGLAIATAITAMILVFHFSVNNFF